MYNTYFSFESLAFFEHVYPNFCVQLLYIDLILYLNFKFCVQSLYSSCWSRWPQLRGFREFVSPVINVFAIRVLIFEDSIVGYLNLLPDLFSGSYIICIYIVQKLFSNLVIGPIGVITRIMFCATILVK